LREESIAIFVVVENRRELGLTYLDGVRRRLAGKTPRRRIYAT
jgi:hypothetical protein